MQGDDIFKNFNDALNALNKATDKDRPAAQKKLDETQQAVNKEIARRIAAHDED